MNSTKWRMLFHEINDLKVNKRVKYIDSIEPSNWQISVLIPVSGYVEFSCGPYPFRYIEWLEIQKIFSRYRGRLIENEKSDLSLIIDKKLSSLNLDVEQTLDSFIVYGYRRASQ